MFEKIIAKIRPGSDKTKVAENMDKDETPEKKKSEEKVK